jgi:hypothetical protein
MPTPLTGSCHLRLSDSKVGGGSNTYLLTRAESLMLVSFQPVLKAEVKRGEG